MVLTFEGGERRLASVGFVGSGQEFIVIGEGELFPLSSWGLYVVGSLELEQDLRNRFGGIAG